MQRISSLPACPPARSSTSAAAAAAAPCTPVRSMRAAPTTAPPGCSEPIRHLRLTAAGSRSVGAPTPADASWIGACAAAPLARCRRRRRRRPRRRLGPRAGRCVPSAAKPGGRRAELRALLRHSVRLTAGDVGDAARARGRPRRRAARYERAEEGARALKEARSKGLGEPRESGTDEEASSSVTAGKMSFFDAPEPPSRFLARSERATA